MYLLIKKYLKVFMFFVEIFKVEAGFKFCMMIIYNAVIRELTDFMDK